MSLPPPPCLNRKTPTETGDGYDPRLGPGHAHLPGATVIVSVWRPGPALEFYTTTRVREAAERFRSATVTAGSKSLRRARAPTIAIFRTPRRTDRSRDGSRPSTRTTSRATTVSLLARGFAGRRICGWGLAVPPMFFFRDQYGKHSLMV